MFKNSIELTKHWAENTTFHAIPNSVRSKNNFLKLIWILAFLGALSFTAFTIIFQFMEFYSYDTLTTIKLVDSNMINFPAITICNINPFSTLDAIKFVSNNSDLASYLEKDYFGAAIALKYAKRAELLGNNINDTFRRSMGLDIDSFVISCYYNGKRCDIQSDFEWSYDSEFANCFTFASGKSSKTVSKIGQDNGLNVNFFVGLPNSIYTLDFFTGAYVFVHNPNSKPIRDQAVQIASGFSNSIGISKLVYHRFACYFQSYC